MLELPPDVDLRWAVAGNDAHKEHYHLLSNPERERYAEIRHPKTQLHFLLGRVALRLLLEQRLGIPAAEVPLVVAADGGVEVAASTLRVSIAHAGNRAVAVARSGLVGVDLEPIRARSPALVGFMLHPSEWDAYAALPLDATHRLILYWTLKEAVLKALRTGLRRSPKQVRLVVDVSAGAGQALLEDHSPITLRFMEHEGYYVSVAYAR